MSTQKIGKVLKCMDKLIMRNAHLLGNKDLQNDLSPMQGWIIGYLYFNRDEIIYQKNLETEFGLPKSTVATLTKNLEEKGYILRENAEHDSRLKRIILSEKAMTLQMEIIQNYQKIDEFLCQGLSQEEIETFLRISLQMKSNLENNIKVLTES